jgi:hypothetical protein
MGTQSNIVDEAQTRIIARCIKLRSHVYANHYGSGQWFAQALAAAWKAEGITGIGNACRDLMVELENVPGGHDAYAEARAIAADCGVFH